MHSNDELYQFNFKFSQCLLLNDDNSSTDQQEQPIDILEHELRDLKIYENQVSLLCGIWTDYPRKLYRMEFRIEMGQLIGYSNVHQGKALTSYDGRIINMVIVYPEDSGRQLNHYRGRLGWSKKYIVWEKQDSKEPRGWRSCRRWIKLN